MPSDTDDEDDRDIEHRRHRNPKDPRIPTKQDSGSNPMSNIFNKLKKKSDKTSVSPSHDTGEKISDAAKLLDEMRTLGLAPAGLGKFIASLHRLAVASGVSPENLASIIKELSTLSEGKQRPIAHIRKHVQDLAERRGTLGKQVADLEKMKENLQLELSLKELEHSTTKETLSEYSQIKQQLEHYELSFADISKLVSLIDAATKTGHRSSEVIDALSKMKLSQEKMEQVDFETGKLLETKRKLQDRLVALERDVSEKEQMLKSAEALERLGFGSKDLEELNAAIRMVAQIRNIDVSIARSQIISDLQGYYANDQELRKRIRVLESLLQEKEEKFNMLQADYQTEKAVLDNARKLISDGVNEQWLVRLRAIVDAYGTDIDMLAHDLKDIKGLKATIEELAGTKKALEEEERLLRQKVVAVEDQRIRTLSLINNLIVNPPKSSARQTRESVGGIKEQQGGMEAGELRELVRAANGDIVDNAEFILSARKAIDTIRGKLPKNSPARLVLEHALLALKHEERQHSG